MASLKTDKSVRWIGWGVFDPRVKTRGYTELADDRDQLNPPIHQWGNTPHTHNLLSVSTDYIVPHVETWGYSKYRDNRDQLNLPIHRWDNTPPTHNPSSVSTDYCTQTQTGGEC